MDGGEVIRKDPLRLRWTIIAIHASIHAIQNFPQEFLPCTESLADTEARLIPYWQNEILPTIKSGKGVLVVAHGNSLRALVRYLKQVQISNVPDLIIPTGVPIFFKIA